MSSVLDREMKLIDGSPKNLADFEGDVVLIVNTASECGLTPQYEGLQKLHEKYADKGLRILAFPANEFGQQEPGSNEQIQSFCKQNYDVDFPLFEKVVVKGEGQCDLYQALTDDDAKPITWNFEKFLVGRDGQVAERFDPKTTPEGPKVTGAIERELGS